MQYTVLLFTICFLLRLPQHARRSRGQTTGYTKPSRTTNRHQPVKVMHWNAEGGMDLQLWKYKHMLPLLGLSSAVTANNGAVNTCILWR